jgi:hypothetical protein
MAIRPSEMASCDPHHPRPGVPGVAHQFPECAFAGGVAFAKQCGKPGIDREAGGGFHAMEGSIRWPIMTRPKQTPKRGCRTRGGLDILGIQEMKDMMRHSDPKLLASVYGDQDAYALSEQAAKLPGLSNGNQWSPD